MQVDSVWKKRASSELAQAVAARGNGNEGMARVCARRAAGLIIGEFLRRHQIPSPGPSAYDHLRLLLDLAEVPTRSHSIAEHLVMRVSQDFSLPADFDLIEDTRCLAQDLLGEIL